MRLTTHQTTAEIPTSSMADVAFLLIIFFLITSTLTASRGLDFAFPPETNERVIEPVESVFVEVRTGGALRVDRRPMPLTSLLAYLEPKLQADPSKPVIVLSDPDAAYGSTVAVLDELRQGRERLGLAEDIQVSLPTRREAAQLGFGEL